MHLKVKFYVYDKCHKYFHFKANDDFDLAEFKIKMSMVLYSVVKCRDWKIVITGKKINSVIDVSSCGNFVPQEDVFYFSELRYVTKIVTGMHMLHILNIFRDLKYYVKYNTCVTFFRKNNLLL